MQTLYVLRTVCGFYYCGSTALPVLHEATRHNTGHGNTWTRRRRGWLLVETAPGGDKADVAARTLDLMHAHGTDYVHGADWAHPRLTRDNIEEIVRRVGVAKNLCQRCGRRGHDRAACTSKQYAHWVTVCLPYRNIRE